MTMFVPRMSAGIRSGVNWMRLKERSSTSPSVRTSSVLPRPGTPSSSTCPPREQRDERALDDGVLADDDFADLRAQRRRRPGGRFGFGSSVFIFLLLSSGHFFRSSK